MSRTSTRILATVLLAAGLIGGTAAATQTTGTPVATGLCCSMR